MNKTLVDLLEKMKHVGAAKQKGKKADDVLAELYNLLPADEYAAISIARGHYLTGEGREELDLVCNRLIQKYRHDPPNRKFTLL